MGLLDDAILSCGSVFVLRVGWVNVGDNRGCELGHRIAFFRPLEAHPTMLSPAP